MKQLLSEHDKSKMYFSGYLPEKYFVISIVFLFAMLMSCKNDIEVINSLANVSNLPSQTIVDLETIYTDSTKLQLKVKADLVKRYTPEEDDPYMEFPKGMEVYFYDKNEKMSSQLSANYAIYYEVEKLWEAQDSVVAINSKGEVLNTEQLFWDEDKKLIYTEEFVSITTDDEIIYGVGMESNESFTDWTIKKPTGTFYIDNE